MESVPRLPDEYLDRAKEIVIKHRKKKNCKYCYDRGYEGVNQDNMLVPCGRCVDTDAVLGEWKELVADTPELTALYGDYYESEEEESSTPS